MDARLTQPISRRIAEEAQRRVEAKLDESFFRVRAERTTELELHYLRAMAELGVGDRYLRRNHELALAQSSH